MSVENKVALVTGASKGIGKAIALHFASRHMKLCLLSRSQAHLNTLVREIEDKYHYTPMTLAMDVGAEGAAQEAISQVHTAFGRVDILINNAGGPPPGSFLAVDNAAWHEAIEKTLLAPIHFATAAAPFMKEQGWGRIINITSLQAKEPSPEMVLSATLRAGVSAFSKAISIELAPLGITVNTVCPSAVLTDRMVDLTQRIAERDAKTYDEVLDAAKARIPMARFSTPDEIASLVGFLASDEAGYITGQSLSIDGGLSKATL